MYMFAILHSALCLFSSYFFTLGHYLHAVASKTSVFLFFLCLLVSFILLRVFGCKPSTYHTCMQVIFQDFYGSTIKFLKSLKSIMNCTMLGFDILQQATDGEECTSVRWSDCRVQFSMILVRAPLLECNTGGCSAKGRRTFEHLFQMCSAGGARCGWRRSSH